MSFCCVCACFFVYFFFSQHVGVSFFSYDFHNIFVVVFLLGCTHSYTLLNYFICL